MIDPLNGEINGINNIETFNNIPEGYSGIIQTNAIEVIGPLIKNKVGKTEKP